MPRRSVIVTFDDGYADNYHEALPILEAHKAQAIFYISTGLLDSKFEFWWDDLERIFLTGHPLPDRLTLETATRTYVFDTKDTHRQGETYQALHPLIKQLDIPERDAALTQIVKWSGLGTQGRDSHRIMTVRELQALAKSKAAFIGAHTHSHPRLSNSTREVQKSEIVRSKEILEGILNTRVIHFSYPFGTREDFNHDSVSVCKELGFEMVCANFPGQVHTWHNSYALPRVIVRNWPVDEFSIRMKDFFNS
jgi:peptidoglycan/xylan/chitin deacetylase (PgdA/CDA1 family)